MRGLVFSQHVVAVTEGTGSGNYTVKLSSKPYGEPDGNARNDGDSRACAPRATSTFATVEPAEP